MSKIILYHGSNHIIEKPTLGKGKVHNDYGQGFYCTKHIELAKEWAVDELQNGFVNSYELELKGLNILHLNSSEYSILHWLSVLVENRTFKDSTPIMAQGRNYLLNHYHIDLSPYDVIVGYRADDSYFAFARGFLSNSVTLNQLEEAMYLGDLGMQYFLKSEKAFQQMKYINAELVDYSDYYPLKSSRNALARKRYQEITQSLDQNGAYLMDIIRKEG